MQLTTLENWAHDLRVKIDDCIKNAKATLNTKPEKGGRELALAHTKLQEAKMWIGKFLEENGNPLPKEFRDESVRG